MCLTIILASSLIVTPSSMYICIHELTHIQTNTYTHVYKHICMCKTKENRRRSEQCSWHKQQGNEESSKSIQLHKEEDTATHTRSSESETNPGPIMLLVLLMLNSSALNQICQPNFRDNMWPDLWKPSFWTHNSWPQILISKVEMAIKFLVY